MRRTYGNIFRAILRLSTGLGFLLTSFSPVLAETANHPRVLLERAEKLRELASDEEDFNEAIAYYRRAAEAALNLEPQDGYTYRQSLYELARMIDKGQGTGTNQDKAECLYKASADNNYAPAQYRYSVVLFEKPGIFPDTDYVMDYFERAAAQGHPTALSSLGYLRSFNPFADNAEGFMYMVLADQAGVKIAGERLAEAEALDDPETDALLAEARQRAKTWRVVPEAPPTILVQPQFPCDS